MSIYAAITFPLLAVTSRFEECARGLTGTVAELRDYAFCYGHLTTFKTGITGTYFKTTYWILYLNPPTNQINLPQLIRSHKKQ